MCLLHELEPGGATQQAAGTPEERATLTVSNKSLQNYRGGKTAFLVNLRLFRLSSTCGLRAQHSAHANSEMTQGPVLLFEKLCGFCLYKSQPCL